MRYFSLISNFSLMGWISNLHIHPEYSTPDLHNPSLRGLCVLV